MKTRIIETVNSNSGIVDEIHLSTNFRHVPIDTDEQGIDFITCRYGKIEMENFIAIDKNGVFGEFDGIFPMSYFHGMLVKLDDSCEYVQIWHYRY